MTEKSYFAGFGGQGIISLGQIWAYCGMKEGKNVSFYPFYGAEKRGGVARAGVIASDEEIASPVISQADSVLVMNPESLPLCEKLLKKNGLMVINSSLAANLPQRSDIRVVKLPAQELAQKIGDVKILNMIALGAIAKLTGALHLSFVEEILYNFFPPSKHKFVPLNVRAIRAGMEAVTPVETEIREGFKTPAFAW